MNRLIIGGIVAAVATVGGVGVWLGASGAVDLVGDSGAPASVSGPGVISYFACPNDGRMGSLQDGDRVYLTGRDASGDWVEVRSPEADSGAAWVRAEAVDPDGEADLPEVTCERTTGEATTATTAVAPGETTTTTVPEATTTTVEGETTTTTEGPIQPGQPDPSVPPNPNPNPTPTTRPDTPAPPKPTIGTIGRSPASLTEQWDNVCGARNDYTSQISATITGATSATLEWNVGPTPRRKAMQRQGSTFSAVLGPFGGDVVQVPSGSVPITVTVVAVGPGGETTRTTTVTLNDCFFG